MNCTRTLTLTLLFKSYVSLFVPKPRLLASIILSTYFDIIYKHTLMTKVHELNIYTITFDDVKLNFQRNFYTVYFDLFEIATNCAEWYLSNPSKKEAIKKTEFVGSNCYALYGLPIVLDKFILSINQLILRDSLLIYLKSD